MNETQTERNSIAEAAFRRGVVHGLHAVIQFIETKRGGEAGADMVLSIALDEARKMRFDREPHEWFTHDLVNRVIAVLDDYDRFYEDRPGKAP